MHASEKGEYISTFISHRSPLGLAFDRKQALSDNRYKGKGFMLIWIAPGNADGLITNGSDTSTGVFSGFSEDLVLIEPYQSSYDEIKCTRLVDGFNHPSDLVCTEKGLFVIESNQGSPNMYRIYFDKPFF